MSGDAKLDSEIVERVEKLIGKLAAELGTTTESVRERYVRACLHIDTPKTTTRNDKPAQDPDATNSPTPTTTPHPQYFSCDIEAAMSGGLELESEDWPGEESDGGRRSRRKLVKGSAAFVSKNLPSHPFYRPASSHK